MPMVSGCTCSIEVQKASMFWPDMVRPLLSMMVTETSTGTRTPRSRKTSSMAAVAALAFSVSKMVSTSSTSEPPSSRPRVCSA